VRRWRLFFLLFISAPAYCYPDTFSHRQVGPQTLLGTCPRRSIVSAPTGAPPEARLNMEGMENIGFKARNGGRWRPGGGRRLEVGAQPQRDAVRVRRTKRWPTQLFVALFVSASGSFWPPKAAADCQTLSFSASFYKICWGQKPYKININT
jgi:hypothetical protein